MKKISKIILGLLLLTGIDSDIYGMKAKEDGIPEGESASKRQQLIVNADDELSQQSDLVLESISNELILSSEPINTPERVVDAIKALVRLRMINRRFCAFLTTQKIIYILREAGVNFNIVNRYGETALHIAAVSDYANCIKILLDAGVNPSTQDNERYTALDLAVEYKCPKSVEILKKYSQYQWCSIL